MSLCFTTLQATGGPYWTRLSVWKPIGGWSNDWIDELQAINAMHLIGIFSWTLEKYSNLVLYCIFLCATKNICRPIQSYWNVLWPVIFSLLSCCISHLKTWKRKYILDPLCRLENHCSLYCQMLHQLQEVILEVFL